MRTTFCLLMATTILAGCGDGMDSGQATVSASSSGGGVSAGTSPPAAVSQALSASTPVDPALVAADNGFGVLLFQNLLSQSLTQNPNLNVAISPLSIAMALQITYSGAAGTSAQAMAQTLQLGALTTSELNSDNAALEASLISADSQVQVIVANSLWMHLSSNPIAPAFIQIDQTYYGAEIGDLSGAPADINAWSAQQTQGLITQIAPTGVDYSKLTAVIANTVYFKGAWTSGFDPAQTAPAAFTRSDGTQPTVPFMHQTQVVPYVQGSNYQAVSLMYGQGHYSMLIVLPDPEVDFGSFAASLTAQNLTTMVSQMQAGSGTLSLPKFTASFAVNLVNALGSLGMTPAFCPTADFPLLDDGCISWVQHQSVVEVDEIGTVAAAGTAVGVAPTVAPASPPPFVMSMDHPFIYLIRDDDDGEVLFIGALLDPSAAASAGPEGT
jgi:serine protease inhibitor